MVNLETVDEIVEELADLLGIYGTGPEFEDHPDNCLCRICFVIIMTNRIRQAIINEQMLKVHM